MRRNRGHGDHHRRLFWRVYLHGVLLIVIVGLTVATAAHFKEPGWSWRENPRRLAQWVANQLGESVGDPELLHNRLQHLCQALEVSAAVYVRRWQLAGQIPHLRWARRDSITAVYLAGTGRTRVGY